MKKLFDTTFLHLVPYWQLFDLQLQLGASRLDKLPLYPSRLSKVIQRRII